jgi:hypothetical protein
VKTHIVHSSATPFDNVNPDWTTYCGLTAVEVAELVVHRDPAGFSHGWRPNGEMDCAACRLAALPWNLQSDNVEEWLAQ